METLSTYSAWVNLLEKFGIGDDTSLEELSYANFTLDAGTASRFYLRVEDAYKKRKQTWLDKFQHSFKYQKFRAESDFEIALRNGKQNLYPLQRFVGLKGLPEDLKKTLRIDLEEFISEIRKSLKDNISKTSRGRENMLILLNSFGLTNSSDENKINTKNNEIIPITVRKIIF
ncbi:hypothetical protein [Pedobacter nototheniae]|uniref:hypothetical protein n=1 Tax=Pedobacter nototheniae TaxID=2488994 RepID=UPI001038E5AB|nr:hypothetical protein [Pedobacter nototheniae]